MRKKIYTEKGFTLIEVIMTLILVGITAVLGGMLIVSVVEGYLFARANASTVQKAQLAMARLTKEFTAISSVTSSSAGQITYVRPDSSLNPQTVTVSLNGDELEIDGSALTDSVHAFELAYCDHPDDPSASCPSTWQSTSKIIEITLTISGASEVNSEFKKRVSPRNM